MDFGCHTVTQICYCCKNGITMVVFFLIINYMFNMAFKSMGSPTIFYKKTMCLWLKSRFSWKYHGVTLIKIAYILVMWPKNWNKYVLICTFIAPLHLGNIIYKRTMCLWLKYKFRWKCHGVTLTKIVYTLATCPCKWKKICLYVLSYCSTSFKNHLAYEIKVFIS